MNETVDKLSLACDIELDLSGDMSLSPSDSDSTAYVARPLRTPLGASDTHAVIKVVTDNGAVELDLSGVELDALDHAIDQIKEYQQSDRATIDNE
jgi:hypothetical protein